MTNGSWELNVRGDGGPPAIDVNGVTRYHAYTGTQFDVNFEGNVQGSWIWISDPMAFSGQASAFYAPLEADPVVSETAFAGMQNVWRTKTAGNADKQFLRDHCNTDTGDRAFTGPNSGCGDWVPPRRRSGRPLGRAGPRQGRRSRPATSCRSSGRRPTGRRCGSARGAAGCSSRGTPTPEPASAVTYTRLDTTGAASPVPERDRGRPERPEPRVRLVLGLRRLHAATPGTSSRCASNPATGTAT